MGYMFKALNLTDAQKAQVKSIMQANRATNRPLMQQMAQNRLAMLTATSNGAFDQAKVTALANQQAQLMAQMTVQKETIQHQIYTQVLTPEQRATADQMRQKQITRITEHLQKMVAIGNRNSGPVATQFIVPNQGGPPRAACPFIAHAPVVQPRFSQISKRNSSVISA